MTHYMLSVWRECEIKVDGGEDCPPSIAFSQSGSETRIFFNVQEKLDELIEKLQELKGR